MDKFPHTPIPRHGLARAEVLAQLLAMKQGDQDWRGGRVFSLVYSAGDEVHELLQDALSLYSAENGLNVLAFPSIGTMQHDIVRNTATLLGADDPASGGDVEGYLTSGGTESLLQAVKTARDVARQDRGIRHPRVVAGESAHAAFTKAADYFDVELVRVPVGADFRVDVDALADACTDSTIMVVGSAPTYPHGRGRPHRRHRRAGPGAGNPLPRRCVHGWLPPSLPDRARSLLRAVRLPPARRHLHVGRRAQVRLRLQGRLGDPLPHPRTGPAPGLRHQRLARRLLRLDGHGRHTAGRAHRRRLGRPDAHRAGRLPRRSPGRRTTPRWRCGPASSRSTAWQLRGDPPATVMAFGAGDPAELDIFAVGEKLAADGWYLDRQNRPDSLHATVHAGSAATVPFLVRRPAARRQRHGERTDRGPLHHVRPGQLTRPCSARAGSGRPQAA